MKRYFCKIAFLLVLLFNFGCSTKVDIDKPNAIIKGDTKFYVTKTGTKYHNSDCYHLQSSYWIYYIDALLQGYDSCLDCKPGYVGLSDLELKFRSYYYYNQSTKISIDYKLGVTNIVELLLGYSRIVEIFNVNSESEIISLVGQLNKSSLDSWNFAANFKETNKYYLWNSNIIKP